MNEQASKIDDITAPRFVFRTFGHKLTKYQEEMAMLSIPVPEDIQVRIFDEVYVISNTIDDVNIKVKSNKLDVKKLIHSQENLEQWDTIKKQDFPIPKQTLIDEIFPLLKVDGLTIEDEKIDKDEFIYIIEQHEDLIPVPVQKQRHAYIINLSICEFAQVIIKNEYLYSVSVESTDVNEVLKTVKDLKLESFENINYIQAIKRVSGIVNKPLIN